MSAFDAADFGWENAKNSDDRRDDQRKRYRSRSRSGGRGHRERSRDRDRGKERHRSRERTRERSRDRRRGHSKEQRDQRDRGPTGREDIRPASPVASGVALFNAPVPQQAPPPQHHAPPPVAAFVVRSFPFDAATGPTKDWWCGLCSNPNPASRWDCVRCGALHMDDGAQRSVRPSTELMSDFISVAMVHSAAVGASTNTTLDAAVQDAARRYCHGDYSPEEERNVLHAMVLGALKQRPECNSLLMYDCIVEDAVLTSDGSFPNEGYVLCLRFFTVPQAKQCLLALQSSIPLVGLLPENGTRFAASGRVRVGFSTRRLIPKPPALSSSSRDSAPILDIHSEKPASEAPTEWEPPTLANDGELRAYLVKLFDQWDTLIPQQKAFYEAHIARVAQQQPQQKAAEEVSVVPATSSSTGGAGPADVSSIKKRLEEKRLALQRQRDSQVVPPSEATTAEAPSPASTSSPATGAMSVLERLALKRAQLQKQATEGAAPSDAPQCPPREAHGAPTEQPKPVAAPLPPALSLLTMLPMPPNFPTKTDYTKQQLKSVNHKVVLHLNGIPMDVSSRVLNAKFL